MRVLEFIALILTPSAAAYAVFHFSDAVALVQRLAARRRPAPPQPVGPPIQRLAADLHRLSQRLDALVTAGPMPGRFLRVQSTTAAYDDTLLLACRALEVEPAGLVSPMSGEQRRRTEASLAGAGLRW